jgi:Protein of unknown function (DUF2946)
MRLPRLGRAFWAIWLGLLAGYVHAALPILIAADILFVSASQDGLRICSAASVRATSPNNNNPEPADRPAHRTSGAVCPLCLALSANAAFTRPSAVRLPPPSAAALPAPQPREGATQATAPARAYRSRAPPL